MIKKISIVAALVVSSIAFSQNTAREKLGNYLDSLMVHHKVMGSFAFADKDQPTFLKVTGFSDVDNQQKANMNTQYRVGSISKTFTAVLVMKAVEDKKLSLNTKLSQFFPEIENADKISIEQLLQHRSGIHNLTDEKEYSAYFEKPQTTQELVRIIKSYKNDFEPGTKFEYSNSNYILLGFIVEKIYKKSYADLIQDKIARPLELTRTEVGGKIDPAKNQAFSYNYENEKYMKSTETDMSIPIGAGNIISTPTELLKFIIGLQNGKLITQKSLKEMKNYVDNYGFGVTKVPFGASWGFGHNGGIDQFRSVLYYFPDLHVAISFITNQSNYNNNDISIKMIQAALGQNFEIPEFKDVAVSTDILKKYEGNYVTKDFPLAIKIFLENGALKAQAMGQGAFSLEAVSENEFKFDMAGIKIKFNPEKNTLDFAQGKNQFTFKKE
ncbi:serine hydrolase domain-containing protein [Chryseobacterium sp. MYb264]|uniref:serine hydrolase domain-containing protein n=1 Tax=Chryseobacterium sp. MYb264 TaxID=2745153 RepID=UPI002E0FF99E|nr:serine hydrolase domain-containing protein [Chryseobacterium sp. MYb264]